MSRTFEREKSNEESSSSLSPLTLSRNYAYVVELAYLLISTIPLKLEARPTYLLR